GAAARRDAVGKAPLARSPSVNPSARVRTFSARASQKAARFRNSLPCRAAHIVRGRASVGVSRCARSFRRGAAVRRCASRCYTSSTRAHAPCRDVMRVGRSARRLGKGGVFLLVAATWPARSLAQPPRTEAPRSEAARSEAPRANPEAQARFEAGVAAYEQRRYREAIERFKEAD